MKTSTLKSATATLTVCLLIFLASPVGNVYGQWAAKDDDPYCPGLITVFAIGQGSTRTAALANLNANINDQMSFICDWFSCWPSPHPCVLVSATPAGKVTFTLSRDATRVNGQRWTYRRDMNYDCQCSAIAKTDETNSVPSAVLSPGSLQLFPNPATEQFSFSTAGYEGQMQLRVVNMMGQVVIDELIELRGETLYSIDISSLPAGIYQVSLSNGSVFETGTFRKE